MKYQTSMGYLAWLEIQPIPFMLMYRSMNNE